VQENEQKTTDAQLKGKVEMLNQLVEEQKVNTLVYMSDSEPFVFSDQINEAFSLNYLHVCSK
jgi:hypothetical protein